MRTLHLRKITLAALVTSLLAFEATATATPTLPHEAGSSPTTLVATGNSSAYPSLGLETRMSEVSKADVTTDPAIISQRVEKLRQSKALVDFLSVQLDDLDDGLQSIAMIATDDGIEALVRNTEGKKFVVSSSDLGVSLVPEGTRVRTRRGVPTCWKGWMAAASYFAASEMTCGPFFVAGGIPGIICNGVFFTMGMLPDFDKPCKKK